MEDHEKEQLEALQEMRSLMERSSRFVSLSGLSGVSAGVVALAASFYMYRYFDNSFYYFDYHRKVFTAANELNSDFLIVLFSVGISTLIIAFTAAVLFTVRKAKKNGLAIWDRTAQRMLLNMFLPLFTGGIFILGLIYHNEIDLIGPATLIFYGLALIIGSKYTLNDIRFLGMAQIILGLISTFIIGYALLFWAIGFGVLHILYGIYMYLKYDR